MLQSIKLSNFAEKHNCKDCEKNGSFIIVISVSFLFCVSRVQKTLFDIALAQSAKFLLPQFQWHITITTWGVKVSITMRVKKKRNNHQYSAKYIDFSHSIFVWFGFCLVLRAFISLEDIITSKITSQNFA